MQATFFQKLILAVLAGFAAACLVWFYRNIIEKGNDEINKNYRNSTGTTAPVRAR